MFLGEFAHSLDSKARLTIPSRYRNHFATGIVITRSLNEQCLKGFPMAEWQKIADKVDSLPQMDRRANQLRRRLFSQAEMLDLDKQGRVLISQRLRAYAQIDSDVIIAGMNSHIEFWHPAIWEQVNSAIDDEPIEGFDV